MPVVMITGGKGAIGSWVCRGLVGYCILDISRARKELGYSPQYNLGDGVKHYIEIMKRLKIEPKQQVQQGFKGGGLKLALGKELLILPRSTALGDYFAFATEGRKADERLGKRYSFASSVYFEGMAAQGLYTMNLEEIRKRVENTGLTNIFAQRIV